MRHCGKAAAANWSERSLSRCAAGHGGSRFGSGGERAFAAVASVSNKQASATNDWILGELVILIWRDDILI